LKDGTGISDMYYTIMSNAEWTFIGSSGTAPTINSLTGVVSGKASVITSDYITVHILCGSPSLNVTAIYAMKFRVNAQ
jgi:hypothetical protein